MGRPKAACGIAYNRKNGRKCWFAVIHPIFASPPRRLITWPVVLQYTLHFRRGQSKVPKLFSSSFTIFFVHLYIICITVSLVSILFTQLSVFFTTYVAIIPIVVILLHQNCHFCYVFFFESVLKHIMYLFEFYQWQRGKLVVGWHSLLNLPHFADATLGIPKYKFNDGIHFLETSTYNLRQTL